jgi:hypothetical protein
MEIVLVAVGLWLLLGCFCAVFVGRAASLGDELWREGRAQANPFDVIVFEWPDRPGDERRVA